MDASSTESPSRVDEGGPLHDERGTPEGPVTWALVWEGRTWRSEDLTGEHATIIAGLVGRDGWEWEDPAELLHPARGPLTTLAILVAFLCVDAGTTTYDEALELLTALSKVSMVQLRDAVHVT